MYILFSSNAVDNLEYQGGTGENDTSMEAQIVERAQNRLEAILLIVDGLIVVLTGGMSYYVAGKTLRPVADAYAAQKKFVADAAHELRTPLTVLRTGAETVLNEGGSKEEYEKYIRDSLEESECLTGLVNDLLFLARGKDLRKAEQVKLDFGLIARQQAEFMRPYARMKKVRISYVNGENANCFVKGNPDQLKRLLNNLIKNAIDYNREEGAVDISLNGDSKQMVLRVANTGGGIDSAEIPNIYERFYKSDAARARATGGSGLGLSIVREIVEAHKGKIDIKSKPEVGTEVFVSFPAA